MAGPVEIKVSAATIASAVTGLGLWALQTYVFKGEVPMPVAAAVQTVVPAIVVFVAGWLAPHTQRPDLAPPTPPVADDAGRHAWDGDPGEIPVNDLKNRD